MSWEDQSSANGGPRLDFGSRTVFLSASIPDPAEWAGYFDALAITDAVVATARAVLTAGGALVTAAHPTIAPLILYVARELPRTDGDRPAVVVYQSQLFRDVLPKETQLLAEGGLAELVWTPATPGDEPIPGRREGSLAQMRERMLGDTESLAAIFIGGMEGIAREFELFRGRFPSRPTYALAQPGGVAASLVQDSPQHLVPQLSETTAYPSVMRDVVEDLAARR